MDINDIVIIVAILAIAAVCITALIVDVFIGLIIVCTIVFALYKTFN